MAHDHAKHQGTTRLVWAVAVNVLLTVAQIVGGLLSGSLSLIADALHNLSDAGSLVIALGARKIAARPADETMTFGYGRAEVVAALINYTILIVLGLYLVYEAVARFLEPQTIEGWMVVWIAVFALAVDLVTAWLTYAISKGSMNIRAAFLHNVADALGSLAVILAGSLVILFGWTWIDPLVTLLIAGYILFQAAHEIGGAVRVLMMATPEGLDLGQLVASLRQTQGVLALHHLHVWDIDESRRALEIHVVSQAQGNEVQRIKQDLRERAQTFEIDHCTIEVDMPDAENADKRLIGQSA